MKNKESDMLDEILDNLHKDLTEYYSDPKFAKKVKEAKRQIQAHIRKEKMEYTDGYHTFQELYDFRREYNAALFNEWALQGKYNVHKSTKHSDGEECFNGGWFIVQAQLPTGQISNHYEIKYWHEFNVPVKDNADEWDGHASRDVLVRLRQLNGEKGGKL